MIFLLTNDDGISAPGLLALEKALRSRGSARIVTVAPAFSCSGMSRSITLYKPVRVEQVGEDRHALDGTPADCVVWGLKHLLREKAAVVISGINHGPNLGDDIAFSGTVAAALEGARYGIPALAVSLASERVYDFTHAVRFALAGVEKLLSHPPASGVAISMNVPSGEPSGVKVTRPGRRVYSDEIVERADPFGRSYYWLAGSGKLSGSPDPGTDIDAVTGGFVSVTPLDSDFHAGYTDMSEWTRS